MKNKNKKQCLVKWRLNGCEVAESMVSNNTSPACRPFRGQVSGSEPARTRPQHFKATHYSQTKTSKYSYNQVLGLRATNDSYTRSKIVMLVWLIDEVVMPDQWNYLAVVRAGPMDIVINISKICLWDLNKFIRSAFLQHICSLLRCYHWQKCCRSLLLNKPLSKGARAPGDQG